MLGFSHRPAKARPASGKAREWRVAMEPEQPIGWPSPLPSRDSLQVLVLVATRHLGARDTSPFLRAEPTLRPTVTATVVGPAPPGLAPRLHVATPTRTGGRPNPSLQRTRYARH